MDDEWEGEDIDFGVDDETGGQEYPAYGEGEDGIHQDGAPEEDHHHEQLDDALEHQYGLGPFGVAANSDSLDAYDASLGPEAPLAGSATHGHEGVAYQQPAVGYDDDDEDAGSAAHDEDDAMVGTGFSDNGSASGSVGGSGKPRPRGLSEHVMALQAFSEQGRLLGGPSGEADDDEMAGQADGLEDDGGQELHQQPSSRQGSVDVTTSGGLVTGRAKRHFKPTEQLRTMHAQARGRADSLLLSGGGGDDGASAVSSASAPAPPRPAHGAGKGAMMHGAGKGAMAGGLWAGSTAGGAFSEAALEPPARERAPREAPPPVPSHGSTGGGKRVGGFGGPGHVPAPATAPSAPTSTSLPFPQLSLPRSWRGVTVGASSSHAGVWAPSDQAATLAQTLTSLHRAATVSGPNPGAAAEFCDRYWRTVVGPFFNPLDARAVNVLRYYLERGMGEAAAVATAPAHIRSAVEAAIKLAEAASPADPASAAVSASSPTGKARARRRSESAASEGEGSNQRSQAGSESSDSDSEGEDDSDDDEDADGNRPDPTLVSSAEAATCALARALKPNNAPPASLPTEHAAGVPIPSPDAWSRVMAAVAGSCADLPPSVRHVPVLAESLDGDEGAEAAAPAPALSRGGPSVRVLLRVSGSSDAPALVPDQLATGDDAGDGDATSTSSKAVRRREAQPAPDASESRSAVVTLDIAACLAAGSDQGAASTRVQGGPRGHSSTAVAGAGIDAVEAHAAAAAIASESAAAGHPRGPPGGDNSGISLPHPLLSWRDSASDSDSRLVRVDGAEAAMQEALAAVRATRDLLRGAGSADGDDEPESESASGAVALDAGGDSDELGLTLAVSLAQLHSAREATALRVGSLLGRVSSCGEASHHLWDFGLALDDATQAALIGEAPFVTASDAHCCGGGHSHSHGDDDTAADSLVTQLPPVPHAPVTLDRGGEQLPHNFPRPSPLAASPAPFLAHPQVGQRGSLVYAWPPRPADLTAIPPPPPRLTRRDVTTDPSWPACLADAVRSIRAWRGVAKALERGLRDRPADFGRTPVPDLTGDGEVDEALVIPASWNLPAETRTDSGAAKTVPTPLTPAATPKTAAANAGWDPVPPPPPPPADPSSSGGGGGSWDAMCSVCMDFCATDTNPLVYCDGCDLGVHCGCYGIGAVPDGEWFCDACSLVNDLRGALKPMGGTRQPASYNPRGELHAALRGALICCLCPVSGGALKRTTDGRWAHVLCALLDPGCWVTRMGSMGPIEVRPHAAVVARSLAITEPSDLLALVHRGRGAGALLDRWRLYTEVCDAAAAAVDRAAHERRKTGAFQAALASRVDLFEAVSGVAPLSSAAVAAAAAGGNSSEPRPGFHELSQLLQLQQAQHAGPDSREAPVLASAMGDSPRATPAGHGAADVLVPPSVGTGSESVHREPHPPASAVSESHADVDASGDVGPLTACGVCGVAAGRLLRCCGFNEQSASGGAGSHRHVRCGAAYHPLCAWYGGLLVRVTVPGSRPDAATWGHARADPERAPREAALDDAGGVSHVGGTLYQGGGLGLRIRLFCETHASSALPPSLAIGDASAAPSPPFRSSSVQRDIRLRYRVPPRADLTGVASGGYSSGGGGASIITSGGPGRGYGAQRSSALVAPGSPPSATPPGIDGDDGSDTAAVHRTAAAEARNKQRQALAKAQQPKGRSAAKPAQSYYADPTPAAAAASSSSSSSVSAAVGALSRVDKSRPLPPALTGTRPVTVPTYGPSDAALDRYPGCVLCAVCFDPSLVDPLLQPPPGTPLSSLPVPGDMFKCGKCGVGVHKKCVGVQEGGYREDELRTLVNKSGERLFQCDRCAALTRVVIAEARGGQAAAVATAHQQALSRVQSSGRELFEPICAICWRGGGLLRKTDNEAGWVHLLCHLMLPDSGFRRPAHMAQPVLRDVDKRRWRGARCTMCPSPFGACIDCESCRTPFHPMCGVQAKVFFGWEVLPGGRGTRPYAYCRQHWPRGYAFDVGRQRWLPDAHAPGSLAPTPLPTTAPVTVASPGARKASSAAPAVAVSGAGASSGSRKPPAASASSAPLLLSPLPPPPPSSAALLLFPEGYAPPEPVPLPEFLPPPLPSVPPPPRARASSDAAEVIATALAEVESQGGGDGATSGTGDDLGEVTDLAALHQSLARGRRVVGLVLQRERLRSALLAAEQASFHATRHALGDATGLLPQQPAAVMDDEAAGASSSSSYQAYEEPLGGPGHMAELAVSCDDHDAVAEAAQAMLNSDMELAAATGLPWPPLPAPATGSKRKRTSDVATLSSDAGDFLRRLTSGATGQPSGITVRIDAAMHPRLTGVFTSVRAKRLTKNR